MTETDTDTAAGGADDRNWFVRAVVAVVHGPRRWSPAVFFAYDFAILAGLLLIGPFHQVDWKSFGNPIPKVMPSAVPWAGALGGVCISLVGVAGHATHGNWDALRYGYWHLTRAALGAIFGSVAVLIVTLLLQNVKPTTSSGSTDFTPSGVAVLSVIAFVVGFREETFRSLIIRVADIILAPSQNDAAVTYALVPSIVDFGDATVGAADPVTKTTRMFNGGQSALTLTSANISLQQQGTDLTFALTPDPATLATGESAEIALTWTPSAAGPLIATMQVNVPGSTIACTLTGTAT
ncbi:MAG: Abnormal spindle-like microcephaly-assocd, ASPM-SPD-2-Hydin [Frankiaceae bacterium]|jgi:hypothetical protein|nr:Abnormal spindle-like microcephaly-assocd, ASPM-SPD-2-Hydin [Frankiaceae bacterium]